MITVIIMKRHAHKSFQVSCNYGRDNFESWGRRRKRREVQLPANVIDNEVDTQMRLSHEIIVLDFGDEKIAHKIY